jgi:hypothetical protein
VRPPPPPPPPVRASRKVLTGLSTLPPPLAAGPVGLLVLQPPGPHAAGPAAVHHGVRSVGKQWAALARTQVRRGVNHRDPPPPPPRAPCLKGKLADNSSPSTAPGCVHARPSQPSLGASTPASPTTPHASFAPPPLLTRRHRPLPGLQCVWAPKHGGAAHPQRPGCCRCR